MEQLLLTHKRPAGENTAGAGAASPADSALETFIAGGSRLIRADKTELMVPTLVTFFLKKANIHLSILKAANQTVLRQFEQAGQCFTVWGGRGSK